MPEKPLNRVEALYLRIHDTPDEQAYISIETSDAKHLTQYAWEKYSEASRLTRENERLREQLRIAEGALTEIARCGCSACGPAPRDLAHARTLADDALTRMSVVE